MRAGFFAIAIETWNRRLKTSSRSSLAFCSSSVSLRSRRFVLAFIAAPHSCLLALDHLGSDGQLLARQTERLPGDVLGQPFHLIEDPARLDHGDPVLGIP